MKKLLLTLVAALSFTALAIAQNNSYTIVLKNGLRVDCVLYRLADAKDDVSIIYADGKTTTVKLADIEKIEIIKGAAVGQDAAAPIVLDDISRTPLEFLT